VASQTRSRREDPRPNLDALLSALRADKADQRRGKLTVFFGLGPGVGKTYAMLTAAARARSTGRKVVIGFVETHGREETEALTQGLPVVPALDLEHHNVTVQELDLEAVLALHPEIVLVDDLAHTNAPGSRHPKRYQDVLDLLDAGIDVFATVSVHQIESRAEAASHITGVTVRETVPDAALENAVLELVDLLPEEMCARVASGKIFVPGYIGTAEATFFSPNKLAALREFALRFGAEHAGQDITAYRQAWGIGVPWKSDQRLLVAIGAGSGAAALVRWTSRLADQTQAPWVAAYVELRRPLTEAEQSRLAKHIALARELGARVVTTVDDDPVQGLLRIAREQKATQLVVEKPARWHGLDFSGNGSLLKRLLRESGDIDVHAVRVNEDAPLFRWPARPRLDFATAARPYAQAICVIALVTVINRFVQHWVGYHSVALLYLLSVMGLALFVGRGPTLAAAALTALSWDFFFTAPVYSLRISSRGDLMMFLTYFVAAVPIGHLAARLREQQAAERRREQRATALYLLTRELAQASNFADLLATIVREVGAAVQADVALWLPQGGREGQLTPYGGNTWTPGEEEQNVAWWAFLQRQPAGRGTAALPSVQGLHLPLLAGQRAVGVLSLHFHAASPLLADHRDLLDACVRQIALVLDRQRLREAEQQAKLVAESERLSKTLLNSVSHEMRTPIAAIAGAASNLSESADALVLPFHKNMVDEIQEATQRLNRLVENLLNMARLESGHAKPKLDWCDVTDLVQVTLSSVEKTLGTRKITVVIAPGLPLVQMDFVLMEQVLTNLLLNAAAHTPARTPIQVEAKAEGVWLVLSVADEGPGLPPEAVPFLFEKFYRAPKAPAGGTGLGLAIVKGFVEAQGGGVVAENRPEGGARFTVRLPLAKEPSLAVIPDE